MHLRSARVAFAFVVASGCSSGAGPGAPERTQTGRAALGSCLVVERLANSPPANGPVSGIAVDEQNVYWAAGSAGVWTVPIAGGPKTRIAEVAFTDPAVTIAVDETYVFFSAGGDVRRVAKSGGAATTLATGQTPSDMAVDGVRIYWTNVGNPIGQSSVASVPKDGGATTVLAAMPYLHGMAVDESYAYFTQGGSPSEPGAVWKVPVGGGPPTPVFTGDFGWWAVSSYGPYLGALNRGQATVWRVDKATGARAMLGQLGDAGSEPMDIAIDAADAFTAAAGYQSSEGSGDIRRFSLAGGPPAILADRQDKTQRLAVDAQCAYWTNYYTGDVMKGPKYP